jgi:hypothetical protein
MEYLRNVRAHCYPVTYLGKMSARREGGGKRIVNTRRKRKVIMIPSHIQNLCDISRFYVEMMSQRGQSVKKKCWLTR